MTDNDWICFTQCDDERAPEAMPFDERIEKISRLLAENSPLNS
jgi:hypothetical protein